MLKRALNWWGEDVTTSRSTVVLYWVMFVALVADFLADVTVTVVG